MTPMDIGPPTAPCASASGARCWSTASSRAAPSRSMRKPRSSSRYSDPGAGGPSADDRALTTPTAAKALTYARNWANSRSGASRVRVDWRCSPIHPACHNRSRGPTSRRGRSRRRTGCQSWSDLTQTAMSFSPLGRSSPDFPNNMSLSTGVAACADIALAAANRTACRRGGGRDPRLDFGGAAASGLRDWRPRPSQRRPGSVGDAVRRGRRRDSPLLRRTAACASALPAPGARASRTRSGR